ncbi:LysE family translocator [Saccharothrix xinjiangensis]|uniref:LysE family translocator n=1 Tax=Saccharothrix xinjiangensis TaxID=204798 RepID=A0ABV9XUZ7_9PSEU
MDALGLGLSLGLAASISPGPLLVLVVTSALRSGRRAGVLAACAPLLSDAAVVGVTLLLLDRLPERALGVLGVVGAVFVVWNGVATVRDARTASLERTADPAVDSPVGSTAPPSPDQASQESPPKGTPAFTIAQGSDNPDFLALRRAVLVNLLSPHPWVAWATALGPLTVTTWRASTGAGVALLAGFYVTLVGGKVVIALLVARGRRHLGDAGYRRALVFSGVLLVVAGVALGVEFGPTLFGW